MHKDVPQSKVGDWLSKDQRVTEKHRAEVAHSFDFNLDIEWVWVELDMPKGHSQSEMRCILDNASENEVAEIGAWAWEQLVVCQGGSLEVFSNHKAGAVHRS